MFGILRKKLRHSVDGLARRAEREYIPEEPPAHEKAGKSMQAAAKESGGLLKKIKEKEFSAKEMDKFFSGIEIELMQANLALEVIDYLKSGLKASLVGRRVSRKGARTVIQDTFERLLLDIVRQGDVDIEQVIRENRPACMLFLGFNGSGKTTTIAKIANMLQKGGESVVFAAADTFRDASIEQLEVHAKRLNVKVIKHKYGADPAAVIFDAKRHAESKGLDVVLADSAGRMHTNANLMDELKKIVRVNKPDLKILVVDSLTGNDVVKQVRQFNEHVGIDAIVMTKTDVNEKGGSIISACYTAKKPVIFLGTGQDYDCIEKFEPEKFVKNLLE